MTIKFCTRCNNWVEANFNNDVLTFKCATCHIDYPSNQYDTLRKESIKESDLTQFSKIIDKAVYDPATIKASVDCKNSKCIGKLVKQIRIGEDMRLFNICMTCHNKYISM